MDIKKTEMLARARRKKLEEQKKWPPDWPERVSIIPFLQQCKKRGHTVTKEEKYLLQSICDHAVQTGFPPIEEQLSPKAKIMFRRLCGSWQKGLIFMGIPALNKIALNHLKQYWVHERKNGGINNEEDNKK